MSFVGTTSSCATGCGFNDDYDLPKSYWSEYRSPDMPESRVREVYLEDALPMLGAYLDVLQLLATCDPDYDFNLSFTHASIDVIRQEIFRYFVQVQEDHCHAKDSRNQNITVQIELESKVNELTNTNAVLNSKIADQTGELERLRKDCDAANAVLRMIDAAKMIETLFPNEQERPYVHQGPSKNFAFGIEHRDNCNLNLKKRIICNCVDDLDNQDKLNLKD